MRGLVTRLGCGMDVLVAQICTAHNGFVVQICIALFESSPDLCVTAAEPAEKTRFYIQARTCSRIAVYL